MGGVGLLLATLVVAGYFIWFSESKLKVVDCYVDGSYIVLDKDKVQQTDYVVLVVKVRDVRWGDNPPTVKVLSADGAEWESTFMKQWIPADSERKAAKMISLDLYFPIPPKTVEAGRLKLQYEGLSPQALPPIGSRRSDPSGTTIHAINLPR